MNKTSIFTILLTIIGAITAYPQNSVRSIARPHPARSQISIREIKKPTAETVTSEPARLVAKPKAADPDTVYAFSARKRHGWHEPLGLLTPEQAKHRRVSIRFSGKNSKGHWTKMEYIDALGKPVLEYVSAYILKPNSTNDQGANSTWAERIKQACVIEMIPDPAGEKVVQERALDANNNIVFTFSRVPIGNNKYVGSYKNYYGMPAEMREDADASYGTLVEITENADGYETRIEFIDSKGKHKNNADDAYAECFEYDANGNIILQYSVDSIGNKMIDNWGNCALSYTYGKNNFKVSATCLDDKLQPIRIKKIDNNFTSETYKHVYTPNENYDIIQTVLITPAGTPDTNSWGCYKINNEFDSLGNIIQQVGYDEEGKLADIYGQGLARQICKFNDKNQILSFEQFDCENKHIESELYYSTVEYGYTKEGEQNKLVSYFSLDGKEYVGYSEITEQFPQYTEKRTTFKNRDYRIERFDKKGRQTFYGNFSKDSIPLVDNTGWAFKTIEYRDSGEITDYEVNYYEAFDKLSQNKQPDNFNREVHHVDSVKHIDFKRLYFNNQLVDAYINIYDNQNKLIVGEFDSNKYGVACRAGGTKGVRHYSADAMPDPERNTFIGLIGRDEFGEPDYIAPVYGNIYYYSRFSKKGRTDFTADNVEIEDSKKFDIQNFLPKVMSIEITDSIGYQLGLKDNDIILTYGDFTVDLEGVSTEFEFVNSWIRRAVLDASDNKSMTVFRIFDASNNKYGLLTIDNLRGTPSQLGFTPHLRFLTDRQLDRLYEVCDSVIPQPKKYIYGDNNVVFAYHEFYRCGLPYSYPQHLKDCSILLGAYDKGSDKKWDLTSDINENGNVINKLLKSSRIENPDFSNIEYFFTNDADSIVEFRYRPEWNSLGGNALLRIDRLSDEDYAKLTKVIALTSDRMKESKKTRHPLNSKLICGDWEQEDIFADSLDYRQTGYLSFNKKGTVDGKLTCTFHHPETKTDDYGYPDCERRANMAGCWELGEHYLYLTTTDEDPIEYKFIGWGPDENDEQKKWVELYNLYISIAPDEFGRNVPIMYNIEDQYRVLELTKERMVLADNNDNRLTFRKVKDKKLDK